MSNVYTACRSFSVTVALQSNATCIHVCSHDPFIYIDVLFNGVSDVTLAEGCEQMCNSTTGGTSDWHEHALQAKSVLILCWE